MSDLTDRLRKRWRLETLPPNNKLLDDDFRVAADELDRQTAELAALRSRLAEAEARIEGLRAVLVVFTTHFVVKDGSNKERNQYGHLELWFAARSVHEEADAIRNPWMLIGSAEGSFSLACMNVLASALVNADAALSQSAPPAEQVGKFSADYTPPTKEQLEAPTGAEKLFDKSSPAATVGEEWPTVNELEKFLDAIERLSLFEAEQKMIRGYGVDLPRPMPEFVKIVSWLRAFLPAPAASAQGAG
jgi:hypothetical protein